MKTSEIEHLQLLAKSFRSCLPADFFIELEHVRLDLASGRVPSPRVSRGGVSSFTSQAICAVIKELHDLLCTNSSAYRGIRKARGSMNTETVHLVAGIIAGKLASGDKALVIGITAYVILLVAKMSVRVFCNVTQRGGITAIAPKLIKKST